MGWEKVIALNNELEVPLNKIMHEKMCEKILINRDNTDDVIWAIKSLEQEKMLGLCFYYLSESKYPLLKKFGTFDEMMKDDEAVSLIASNEILVSIIIMTGKDIYGDIFSKNQIVQNTILNYSKSFEAITLEEYSAYNILKLTSEEYFKKLFTSEEAVKGFCKSPWAVYVTTYWLTKNIEKGKIFNECSLIKDQNIDSLNETLYFNTDIFELRSSKNVGGQDLFYGNNFDIGTKTEYLYSCSNNYSPGYTKEKYDETSYNKTVIHFIRSCTTKDNTGEAGSIYSAINDELVFKVTDTAGKFQTVNKFIIGGLKGKNITVYGHAYAPYNRTSIIYNDR